MTSQIDSSDSPFTRFTAVHLPRPRAAMDAYRATARAARRPVSLPTPPPRVRPAWGTLGAAIDHRLRYAFTCHQVIDGAVGEGVASAAAWCVGMRRPDVADAILATGRDLESELRLLFERERPDDRGRPMLLAAAAEERLARLCVAMVWFEEVYRSGVLYPGSAIVRLAAGLTLPALLAQVPDYMVDDLTVQVQLAQDALGELRAATKAEECCSGPVFAGSHAVGGADADIIVSRLLLDFKALKDPVRLPPAAAYQLAGYALLDFEDLYHLERVGFYLTRSGQLITWGLGEFADLLGAQVPVPELRAELSGRLAGEDPDAEA
ncbi:hypothetical protein ACGF4C_23975 [Streptomyces sp. NPDC048197]|uniref:hypothetical protein n=1 Tax=Streptomyces sp. NPDC048197 TaxID=3365511 RepID=UPI0037198E6D